MDAADPAAGLLLAAGTRLVSLAIAAGSGSRRAVSRWTAFGGSIAASLLTGGVGLRALAAADPLQGGLGVHAASGFGLGYSIDALSGWFLLVLAVLGIAVAFYSIGYFDAYGTLTRVKVTDPSFRNWPGLARAVPGNLIPDFPVINKSFNLSYSGNDR